MKTNSKIEITIVSFSVAVFSILWTINAGKDLNWDLLNYHFYLPFSLSENRLSKDFFPASIQSYLNPISFFPFYWMVKAEWHSLLIGTVLASLHSINLIVLYLLCKTLVLQQGKFNPLHPAMAFLLGALSPLFWVEIGTSFNDISISLFVLGALYFSLSSRPSSKPLGSIFPAAGAGILLGMATGLKLTFGIFAIGGVALFLYADLRKTVVQSFIYVSAVILGFLLLGGYWAYRLGKEFGNPVFPFFNGVFKSSLYPTENLSITRFIPGSLADLLKLPFEMMEPVTWVYTETSAPDLRFAVLLFLVTAIFLRTLIFSGSQKSRPLLNLVNHDHLKERRFRLYAFLVFSTVFWIATSANGRYAIPIALLVGIPIVNTSISLLGGKWGLVFSILLFTLQLGHLTFTATPRWSPDGWTSRWLELDIPTNLIEKPYLFLSFGNQTNSFIAPFVNPESVFINIVGQASIELDSDGGRRLQKSIEKFQDRTVILMDFYNKKASHEERDGRALKNISLLLTRFGINIKTDSCLSLKLNREDFGKIRAGKPNVSVDDIHYLMRVCKVYMITTPDNYNNRQIWAGKIFDNIATTCPNTFLPFKSAVESIESGFYRHYVGTEFSLRLFAETGNIVAAQNRSSVEISIGNAREWEAGPRKDFSCPSRRRSSPWFDGRPAL